MKTQRFVSSGSLWSLEKVESRFVLRILVRVVFQKSEEPRFVSIPNLGSGRLLKNGKPKDLSSGRLQTNEGTKIRSSGLSSSE
ncbi:unnamed protein product [Rhizophagus irregularis]|nr:unnamed protein product [Rhizophagus irregularis]